MNTKLYLCILLKQTKTMNDYRLIFQKRANDYHFAMQKYPKARIYEFNSLIGTTDFSKAIEILDIPSGGAYLKNFLPKHINLTSCDFSEGFTNNEIKLANPENLPFESNTFDCIFSLSGMHHLNNVPLFVEESLRIIKNDGEFIFADVKKGTSVDVFLNQFVNEYNSLGHQGNFFFEDYFINYPTIQNKIIECKYNQYPFLFENKSDMIIFFRLFFGLDKATDDIIYDGVRDILGIQNTKNGLEVNWGLIQFKLKK
ncbi:class I SAM-dependent methyltransferase [Flavobacterium sp. LMO8]|uniref:class I SAM-dependent methyltransferase n=1 Tax=Flavobacterium sp. LMO8 TaxID=2654244 RepID=UPI00351B6D7A